MLPPPALAMMSCTSFIAMILPRIIEATLAASGAARIDDS